MCMLLLNPLLKTSADLVAKQIQYEKTQALIAEADRALELIGRAIRMAGYQNIKTADKKKSPKRVNLKGVQYLEVQKRTGYRSSDALLIRHELSDGIDFDCIGNTLTQERTKNHLALQGFLVNRQASLPKGAKADGGSLICQSLDRQGRIQNTTLMNGVEGLWIEETSPPLGKPSSDQRLFKVSLLMTDGVQVNIRLERVFATRNFL
ncbi:hypothetical protein [Polynucleobacter sp. AP-Kolm-20A-A1]|uniref:hypothetical protein n=1 Tax=Polynucleobacter sp. AP-Kolm-20A-A1 TaxID=2081041 RepID=UPI001BFDCAB6|nr:hypothetical protein [Polynucleobacter sp. AP-Kolm-20A-A1]